MKAAYLTISSTIVPVLGEVCHFLHGDNMVVKSRVTDALLGLRELLEANPQLIDSSLTTLINTCVRIIADEVSQPQV
jgi:hypothetical protein